VASGALGAFSSALLTVRHERREQWRGRLIGAADEFAEAARTAHVALRGLRAAIINARNDPDTHKLSVREQARANARARELVDAAHTLAGRLQILFGPSDATFQALDFIANAGRMLLATQYPLATIDLDALDKHFEDMMRAHNSFTTAASREVRAARL
jgi:hypothetical protein